MARRSDNTREELKEMAISAGLELLEEAGTEALSARKIAARIGYTVGTLYNMFSDYEDIILHLNAATIRDLHAQLAPLAQARKTPLQRLLNFAHCYGDYALAHPDRWNLLHSSPRSTPLPQWYRTEIQSVFALAEAPLLEFAVLKPATARDGVKILWAGLHGICALSVSQKLEHVGAGPLHKLIDNFVTHYLAGLAANAH